MYGSVSYISISHATPHAARLKLFDDLANLRHTAISHIANQLARRAAEIGNTEVQEIAGGRESVSGHQGLDVHARESGCLPHGKGTLHLQPFIDRHAELTLETTVEIRAAEARLLDQFIDRTVLRTSGNDHGAETVLLVEQRIEEREHIVHIVGDADE